jgi:ribonuclease T1
MRRKANPFLFVGAVVAVLIGAWLQRADKTPAPQTKQAESRSQPASRTQAGVPVQATAPAPPRPQATSRIEEVVPDSAERAQLQATLELIERGGPFPHRQDGTIFGNREGRLPAEARDYYREYTVSTPGAANRGARRVIRGQAGETYYTRDHYRTFMRIE